jgi:hypothetical protein
VIDFLPLYVKTALRSSENEDLSVMSEFQFICPACHQPVIADVDLAGQEVECPGCVRLVKVPNPKLATVPEPESELIHRSAGDLKQISKFFMWASPVVFLIGVMELRDTDGFLIAAGAFLSLGLFLYLVAQVIYCRAILHRLAERQSRSKEGEL